MLDINELIEKDLLISVGVTLSMHSFGNGVGREGGDFSISKLNVIDP